MAHIPDFLSFWGKARPSDGSATAWHPVAYHLIDVAATTAAILDVRPLATARLADLRGLPAVAVNRLTVVLAG